MELAADFDIIVPRSRDPVSAWLWRLVNNLCSLHNGAMKKSHTLLACAAALIAILGLGLSACGEDPVDIDAQAVLSQTSTNMKQLAGFHFVYELHQPESAQKAEGVQKVEADFNAQGEMAATVQYLAGGALINADVVALVDMHYIRFPLAQTWTPMDPADSLLTGLNLSEGPVKILDNVTSPTFVGVEKRAGVSTYHITGQVTAEAIESVVGTVSTADVFVTDLWIGVDDSLLYEVDVDGPMTTKEPPGTFRSIILSNLGATTDIKAPR